MKKTPIKALTARYHKSIGTTAGKMLKVNQKKRIKLKDVDGYLHAEPDIEDALSREVSRQKTLLQYNRQQANKSSGSDLVRLDDSIGSADFHRERRRSSIIMFARDELFINFRELSCSESCYRKNTKLMQMHSDLSADKTRTGSKSNNFVIRQIPNAELIKPLSEFSLQPTSK